jgi:hypothetical protein
MATPWLGQNSWHDLVVWVEQGVARWDAMSSMVSRSKSTTVCSRAMRCLTCMCLQLSQNKSRQSRHIAAASTFSHMMQGLSFKK